MEGQIAKGCNTQKGSSSSSGVRASGGRRPPTPEEVKEGVPQDPEAATDTSPLDPQDSEGVDIGEPGGSDEAWLQQQTEDPLYQDEPGMDKMLAHQAEHHLQMDAEYNEWLVQQSQEHERQFYSAKRANARIRTPPANEPVRTPPASEAAREGEVEATIPARAERPKTLEEKVDEVLSILKIADPMAGARKRSTSQPLSIQDEKKQRRQDQHEGPAARHDVKRLAYIIRLVSELLEEEDKAATIDNWRRLMPRNDEWKLELMAAVCILFNIEPPGREKSDNGLRTMSWRA